MKRADDGFTMVELILAIAITSIIILVIGNAAIIGWKTTNGTEERLAASNEAQIATSFFVSDVQSATTVVNNEATCPAPGGGSVLALKWTDSDTGPTHVAGYAVQGTGSNRTLIRYSCKDGVAQGTVPIVHSIGSVDPSLTCAPVANCFASTPRQITMKVTVDPTANNPVYVWSLSAERRVP
jgi:prepilin-type N-terminal cleavage/methylation domain-containing protein